MSGDSGSKTEKPTPKRIQDAREKGQVSKSSDFNSAIVLIAATGAMAFVGPYTLNTLYGLMQYTFSKLLSSPEALRPMTDTTFTAILSSTVHSMTWLLLPLLLTVMVLGVLSNVAQVKPLFAIQAIAPKLDKLNPLSGFKRMWSLRSVIEVVKAIIKMTVIGACGSVIISSHMGELMQIGAMEVPVAWGVVLGVIGQIALWCCIWFFLMGLIDWRYQAWEFEKQLRMSRQDIKDERKNQEGDPMMKNRIRQMGLKLARTRQLAAVPTADVVITNPTHFAIALKYDPDIAPAPVVVAKGKDLFAQKIKAVAKEHGVPMVENKPLARALYPVVEAEAMVPPDLFVAVAEVLAYVFAKNKGRRLAARKRQAEHAAKKARAIEVQGGSD
ncbi:MAG TPA: flagellar biosynthesis protein FlhB [Coleofasciculaceae cyanobacterium]|jgi:flagellar biosynthetic protein FlhB